MPDVEREVQLTLTAKDLASATVKQVAKAAGKLSDSFDNVTKTVAGVARSFGPLASIFGFGASIHGAKRYLATIEELQTITGRSAKTVAGITHAMEQSGLAGEEVRAIMISMSRKQAELKAGSQEVAKLAKQYGVNLKKGPEEALISMSKQVEKGKIGTGEVVKLLEESGAKAVDLLRKGPVEVQRLLNEGQAKNSHINDNTIRQYKMMDIQMTRVKQAWTRTTTTVAIKLFPVITRMMESLESKIDSWADGAERFGNYLVEHMDQIISQAKIFGKIMLANWAMMKVPGAGGKGILANIGRVGRFAAGGARGAGDITKKIPGLGPILDKFIKNVPILGKIGGVLVRLVPLGAVITAIVAGMKTILDNTEGVRTRMVKLLGGVWENTKGIGRELKRLFGKDTAIGKGLRWLGDKVATFFEFMLWGIEQITAAAKHFVRFVSVITENPRMLVTPVSAWRIAGEQLKKEDIISASKARQSKGMKRDVAIQDALKTLQALSSKKSLMATDRAEYEKATGTLKKYGFNVPAGSLVGKTGARLKALEQPSMVNYQDFRGSRFDIMQQFAEGFDPERIAATFGNDLVNLGERRLQSGLAPAFSVR